jgi:hypothetical protein
MSTPSTPRSPYRNRRINVMLQESQHDATPSSEVERPLRRHTRQSRSPLKMTLPHVSRNTLIVIAAITALVCAALVFLVLSKTGTSDPYARVPSQPVRVESPKPAPLAAPKQAETSNAGAPSSLSKANVKEANGSPAAVAAEQIPFRLKRAARPQAIGVLVLRLVNSNPKKHTCTLAITPPEGRSMQKVLQTDKPLSVPLEDGQSAQVLVSDIGRSGVSGTVTQPDN